MARLLTVCQLSEEFSTSTGFVNKNIKKNGIDPALISVVDGRKRRIYDYDQYARTLSKNFKVNNNHQINVDRQAIYTKGFLNVKDPIFRRRTQCQRRAAIDAIERMGGVSRHG